MQVHCLLLLSRLALCSTIISFCSYLNFIFAFTLVSAVMPCHVSKPDEVDASKDAVTEQTAEPNTPAEFFQRKH